jgi:hypothetical protein
VQLAVGAGDHALDLVEDLLVLRVDVVEATKTRSPSVSDSTIVHTAPS